jgi:hypothetical protein
MSTINGENDLQTTGDNTVDLFYNIGSARGAKERVEGIFDKSFSQDPTTTAAILAWSRDIRGGAGERETFRNLTRKLIKTNPKIGEKILRITPKIGRYDDLNVGLNTSIQHVALQEWQKGLDANNELAYKWVNIKKDNILRKHLGLTPKQFRNKIVAGRPSIVEKKMCAKKWSNIEYPKVPSVCMKKHSKAFSRNDGQRFESWINDTTAKVNASALYPYQIYQTCVNGEHALADKQWKALNIPMNASILPMIDVSGSMGSANASKGVTCMDVSISLGTYISQNSKGFFKNKMLTFDTASKVLNLPVGKPIKEVFSYVLGTPWGGSTNFESAYTSILSEAIAAKVPQDQMPEYIVVLSDMQFNEATNTTSYYGSSKVKFEKYDTAHAKMKKSFETAGYVLPKVIYWNLNAQYDSYPTCSQEEQVALVSGFSPFVMKSIVEANLNSISPKAIMNSTIEKYRTMLDEV